ncbi:MAG: methyltransferase family protein [Desulfobaccales bacterium]
MPISAKEILHLILRGGPGFCQIALTNASNARCRFCNFPQVPPSSRVMADASRLRRGLAARPAGGPPLGAHLKAAGASKPGALSTASLISLVLWVAICIFYNYLASYEEKLLETQFGESYIIYKDQTGKWMPRRPFIYKDKDSAF